MLPEKTALIQDWLIGWGGAEQVLLEIAQLFPGAPIYTSLFDAEHLPAEFQTKQIYTSFLQQLPGALKRHRLMLPLMPLAFELFDLNGYDLVISSSHACAKGVIPPPGACHLAYIHTPIRYAWDMLPAYFAQAQPSLLKQLLMHPLLHYLRQWDLLNNFRIDAMACNSRFVKQRIWRYYRREAEVIAPPVKIPEQPPLRDEQDFYLMVSRAVPYKRLDLAIEAFRENGRTLVVVGEGPELSALKARPHDRIQFKGHLSRAEIEKLFLSARALIFPGLEDFGIVPVEAQAFGCPVIAFGQGGVLDSVLPEETGLFFQEQTVQSLNRALEAFEACHFDPLRLYLHAQAFSEPAFQSKFKAFVAAHYAEFRQKRAL